MDQKLSSFLAVGRLCAMNGSGLFLIFFNRVGIYCRKETGIAAFEVMTQEVFLKSRLKERRVL